MKQAFKKNHLAPLLGLKRAPALQLRKQPLGGNLSYRIFSSKPSEENVPPASEPEKGKLEDNWKKNPYFAFYDRKEVSRGEVR